MRTTARLAIRQRSLLLSHTYREYGDCRIAGSTQLIVPQQLFNNPATPILGYPAMLPNYPYPIATQLNPEPATEDPAMRRRADCRIRQDLYASPKESFRKESTNNELL